jgi:amino acid transporter
MAAGESTAERLDRELMELLQGLRVVLPGVQVLLAFLLLAPFQPRFAQLPGSLQNAFFASIACATLATVLLIAPSVHHRLRWRARDKERLLRIGNQVALWGTVFLAAAIVLALYVVTNVLYVSQLALLAAGVAVAVFGWVLYGLPFVGRSQRRTTRRRRPKPACADRASPRRTAAG